MLSRVFYQSAFCLWFESEEGRERENLKITGWDVGFSSGGRKRKRKKRKTQRGGRRRQRKKKQKRNEEDAICIFYRHPPSLSPDRVYERPDPQIDEFYADQKRRSMDSETPKLRKVS